MQIDNFEPLIAGVGFSMMLLVGICRNTSPEPSSLPSFTPSATHFNNSLPFLSLATYPSVSDHSSLISSPPQHSNLQTLTLTLVLRWMASAWSRTERDLSGWYSARI
ncbi:hypothetical protein Droror1_Dr00014147 [Drosera rotundifolia]